MTKLHAIHSVAGCFVGDAVIKSWGTPQYEMGLWGKRLFHTGPPQGNLVLVSRGRRYQMGGLAISWLHTCYWPTWSNVLILVSLGRRYPDLIPRPAHQYHDTCPEINLQVQTWVPGSTRKNNLA